MIITLKEALCRMLVILICCNLKEASCDNNNARNRNQKRKYVSTIYISNINLILKFKYHISIDFFNNKFFLLFQNFPCLVS